MLAKNSFLLVFLNPFILPQSCPTFYPSLFQKVLELLLSINKKSYQIISVTFCYSMIFDIIWYNSLIILHRSPFPSLSALHKQQKSLSYNNLGTFFYSQFPFDPLFDPLLLRRFWKSNETTFPCKLFSQHLSTWIWMINKKSKRCDSNLLYQIISILSEKETRPLILSYR